jgi:NAD(P)-dependent dehydrogenase (short-subunit alcohol dehydrogenase family)
VPDDLHLTPTPGALAGRRAIVTGAARGIGWAIAERLALAGVEVVGMDVLEEQGRTAFAELPSGAEFRPMDVTREDHWADLVSQFGDAAPDLLVNNAGGLVSAARLHEHSLAAWQQTLELNLTSVFLGMRAVIPLMLRAGSGTIVNIASVSGVIGQRDAPAYQAAKAGVLMLTRNAAMTYARDGIRVNAISPSVITTPALDVERDDRTEAFLGRVPMGRAGSPGDVAEAVLYLAGDQAGYLTGANIPVDGGYLA